MTIYFIEWSIAVNADENLFPLNAPSQHIGAYYKGNCYRFEHGRLIYDHV